MYQCFYAQNEIVKEPNQAFASANDIWQQHNLSALSPSRKSFKEMKAFLECSVKGPLSIRWNKHGISPKETQKYVIGKQ
jgi:hypothetical protein